MHRVSLEGNKKNTRRGIWVSWEERERETSTSQPSLFYLLNSTL